MYVCMYDIHLDSSVSIWLAHTVHACMYIYACMYVCMYIQYTKYMLLYVYICMKYIKYTLLYVCMYVCVYVQYTKYMLLYVQYVYSIFACTYVTIFSKLTVVEPYIFHYQYGALTGLSKSMVQERHGLEQFNKWRLSYETAPPPVSPFSGNYPGNDERYVENVCMFTNSAYLDMILYTYIHSLRCRVYVVVATTPPPTHNYFDSIFEFYTVHCLTFS